MPISREFADQFFSDPTWKPKVVRVRTDKHGTTMGFRGESIPIDGRCYIAKGVSILKDGTELPSRFEIDTSKPELVSQVYWYIDDTWYEWSDVDVLEVIGKPKSQVFPFSWHTNVPLDTETASPYLALHLQL